MAALGGARGAAACRQSSAPAGRGRPAGASWPATRCAARTWSPASCSWPAVSSTVCRRALLGDDRRGASFQRRRAVQMVPGSSDCRPHQLEQHRCVPDVRGSHNTYTCGAPRCSWVRSDEVCIPHHPSLRACTRSLYDQHAPSRCPIDTDTNPASQDT